MINIEQADLCDKLKEECGVVGVYSTQKNKPLSQMVYFGLIALQHRGQESSGIAVSKDKKISHYKSMGLVQEVFDNKILDSLQGEIAIGHVRYSTTGNSNVANAQPLVAEYRGGSIALAHNGNLVNIGCIKDELESQGSVFQTSTDSEVIANLIARNYLRQGYRGAIIDSINQIKGSFALVLICEDKLIGVRDPHGLKPLCIGQMSSGYVLASESCALDVIGAKFVRDVIPGEMVVINSDGIESIIYDDKAKRALCAFEFVYFARPDSFMDGKSIHIARKNAGKILARKYPADADMVMAVPDSGIDAAIGFAEESGIPYGIGLIKNKYLGRTFIQPTQAARELAVRLKLNVLKENVKGKKVVLIDDSIVRGTTSKKIIDVLKKAGAKEVHMRISSPPVKHSCYFGIDTPRRDNLVGAVNTLEEIRKMIGAESLAYIDVEGLVEAIGLDLSNLCTACFNGDYPMEVPKCNV